MKKAQLPSRLIIRTAVAAAPGYGFIYASDPKLEKKGTPHTRLFTIEDGVLEPGEYNYSAHSACLITKPEDGVVDVAEPGYYTANTESGQTTNDLFEASSRSPKTRRGGGIRSVQTVDGTAYAVGIRGLVYRLDAPDRWTRIDEGLPEDFDVQAIGGVAANRLCAVGFGGQIWSYDGSRWKRQDSPTKRNLTSVKCAAGGEVYVGGHGGTLLRGRKDAWSVVDHGGANNDIWDLEHFDERWFVATLEGLFELHGKKLKAVDFGKHRPKTTYQLSVADSVMWSIGEHDIVEFDGKRWATIV